MYINVKGERTMLYFHGNYTSYREHNNIIKWNKFSAKEYSYT